MATEQRRYGSLNLTAANGILIKSWDDTPMVAVDHEDRVDGRGSIRARDIISGREISLNGDVTGGGNVDTVRLNLDTFIAALRNRDDYLTLFTDRRILCGLTGLDWHYPRGMQYGRVIWKATLTSTRPTWEAVAASTSAHNITAGTSVSGSMAANAGFAETYPEITLTNQSTSFSGLQVRLINVSTQAELTIDGLELNNGQSIVLDFWNEQVGDGISVPTMPSGISGEWWEISPLATQTLRVVTSATVADLDIDVSFRAQYWSP